MGLNVEFKARLIGQVVSVADYLGTDTLGVQIVELARKVGCPLGLDLLRLPREEARHEAASRIAAFLLHRPSATKVG
jgi:hypothetical protein